MASKEELEKLKGKTVVNGRGEELVVVDVLTEEYGLHGGERVVVKLSDGHTRATGWFKAAWKVVG